MKWYNKAAAAACVAALGGMAHGQTYPVKPVRIVNPFVPGGSIDLVTRHVAKYMSGELGQQVIVENRPGAGGAIGIETVARAPADGYTLLTVQSSLTINPNLQKKVPYDPIRDFAPIGRMSSYMFFAVAHPSLGARTVKQLIALAKSHPGQVNYASVGMGSGTHMSAELFAYMAGVKMVHIPYKGSGQVIPDLLGGQIALHFGSPSVVPHVKSGKLIGIAVTGAHRSPALPELPTIAEAGLKGYEVTSWNALFAPAGTPQAIIERMNTLTRQAMQQPEAKAVMDSQGIEVSTSTPAELSALVKAELAKWARVIKAAGIQPQ
ncbi:MAG TPA: tripartite tricarboxylate transporter substrate binding protein [Burkholderiales bacterium]|nr:tripartite tricarboxylate transporter substrate binding protein [Burkholderiales bacterium]